MMPNAGFWALHIRRVNIDSLERLRQAINHKVLPPFESIDVEAKDIAEREFQQLGQLPASGEDCIDMGDLAD